MAQRTGRPPRPKRSEHPGRTGRLPPRSVRLPSAGRNGREATLCRATNRMRPWRQSRRDCRDRVTGTMGAEGEEVKGRARTVAERASEGAHSRRRGVIAEELAGHGRVRGCWWPSNGRSRPDPTWDTPGFGAVQWTSALSRRRRGDAGGQPRGYLLLSALSVPPARWKAACRR